MKNAWSAEQQEAKKKRRKIWMKIDISQSPGVLDALNAVLNKGSVAELKIEHGRIVVIEIKRTKRH